MFNVCIEIPKVPDPQRIVLPAGGVIEDVNLLDKIQPALAPLAPLFLIVETVTAIIEGLLKLGDVILEVTGPPPNPPNPGAIKKLVPVDKLVELQRLLPQLAGPLMVKGILDAVIQTLQKERSVLQSLVTQRQQIAGAIDRAAELDDVNLQLIADCSSQNLLREVTNVGQRLASLGHIIGIANLFMKAFGQGPLPNLEGLGGQSLENAIAPLDTLIESLETARNALPV